MEGYIKIPKAAFELGLNANEFIVFMNLLKIQDYREYKCEIEDGWFAKSQNELAKECGFGCHKRLTRVLEGMVKKNIVQIKPTKTVTYFKIDMGKMTIGQNEHMGKIPIPTMGKMTVDSMGKMPNLHNNSDKHKEQEYTTINPDCNTTSYTEEQRKCIEEFEMGIGKGITPTVRQIAGFVFKNNITFDKNDFMLNVYDKNDSKVGDKYVATPVELARSGLQKLLPLKDKYEYTYNSDTIAVQEFMTKYVRNKKHQYLNIIVK
jgi:hypothetical protein